MNYADFEVTQFMWYRREAKEGDLGTQSQLLKAELQQGECLQKQKPNWLW